MTALGSSVVGLLPSGVKSVIDRWNAIQTVTAWKDSFSNSNLPVEELLDAVQAAHISSLSSQEEFTLNASLKQVFQSLVTFLAELLVWCPDSKRTPEQRKEIVDVLFPILFNATADNVSDKVQECVNRLLEAQDSQQRAAAAKDKPLVEAVKRSLWKKEEDEFEERVYMHVIIICHDLIINHAGPDR